MVAGMENTEPPKKRGRRPGLGLRLAADKERDVIKVRPGLDGEQRRELEEGALLAGRPPDGRCGGKPALAPWLLELGLRESRRLKRLAKRQAEREASARKTDTDTPAPAS